MKIFLLLVAIWCWGMAFSTLVGTTARIIFGVIGIAVFVWYKNMRQKTPADSK